MENRENKYMQMLSKKKEDFPGWGGLVLFQISIDHKHLFIFSVACSEVSFQEF